MPKPPHTNQIIFLARPALFVNQFPLVLINNNNTLPIQNSFSNLNFEESKMPKYNVLPMELTVKTPKGTADGYSIGIDQDVLMSEVFNDSDLLRLVNDCLVYLLEEFQKFCHLIKKRQHGNLLEIFQIFFQL